MRIAIVCPYDLARPGGVQRHILDLAAYLQGKGQDVTVIGPGGGEAPPSGQVPCRLFGRAKSIVFNKTQMDVTLATGRELRRLEAFLAEPGFDLVHFHTIWDPFLPLQIFRRTAGAARVATFHDTPPDTVSGAVTRFVFGIASRFLSKRLDGLIAVSEAPARHLKPAKGKVLRLLPPSTDLSPLLSRPVPRVEKKGGALALLFLGRLDPRKGVETLIRAVDQLNCLGVETMLTIAGDGTERERLEALATELRLANVRFLGAVEEERKQALLAECDLFCAPSLYGESFGIVLLEAMAAGKPVVAADNLGYGAVLREKRALCLHRPGDPNDLAAKISALRGDDKAMAGLSDWGRDLAARHDISVVGEQIFAVYKSALDGKSPKAAHG